MKLHAQYNKYEFEIQTKNIPTHALLDDVPQLQEDIINAVLKIIKDYVAGKDSKTT